MATTATYTVQPGDSLSLISKKVYGDFNQVDMLARVNNIANKDLISVGQKLVLPGVEEAEVIESSSSSGSATKWILGVLAAGTVGYFGYRYYKKKKLDGVFNAHSKRMHSKKRSKSKK